MKKRVSVMGLAIGATLLAVSVTQAQETSSSISTSSVPTITITPSADTSPAKLPYGVEDVLKLSKAQISQDVILNYIQNSGTVYSLAPADILYLHNEGVSDKVVNAMIEKRSTGTSAMIATSGQGSSASASAVISAPVYQNSSVVVTSPAYETAYVEPEVIDNSGSSLYVIPYYPGGGYYSYPSYYRTGPYCGVGYSTVFNIGGGYRHSGGYYRGNGHFRR
jgi:hypothetical protein